MRPLITVILLFITFTLTAEPATTPDLSRDLREAAKAIGSGNGTDLELSVLLMRRKLTEAGISDDFAAALTLLDLTAGPGTEKLRAVTGRYAVMLAPHLPDAHLRHAQRLYDDGFGSRYWFSAFGGYLTAIDQPLFLWPLRDAVKRPLLFGVAVPFLLLLLFLFFRHRAALLRRYDLPAAVLFMTMLLLCFLVIRTVSFTHVGSLFLLIMAALLFPATTHRERWLILAVTILFCGHYGIVAALYDLPPAASTAMTTATAFLTFTTPGSIDGTTAPYLFHGAALSWMVRHALYAFLFAAVLFLITLTTAFLLARHRADLCSVCGILREPGENARTDSDRCIVCEHIAERQRQIRETEIRRYREQVALKQHRTARWAIRMALLSPGAGLIFRGRSWEGACYLFGAAGLLWFAALWHGVAPLLALYRPLATTPAMVCIISSVILYVVSVTRTYLVERRS